MANKERENSRKPVFLGALQASLGRLPLWFMAWLVPLIGALALAAPWVGWVGSLEHSYAPGSVLASLDETFRVDHEEELDGLRERGAMVAASLALFMMLFGAFAAGGWLQVFLERTSGHSLRRFLWGGARYFWRFARVWVLSLLTLSLLTWVLHGWVWRTVVLEFLFGATGGDLELLESEQTVVRLDWIQNGLYAVLFALVLTWGDYTRTRLALHNSRSALWAGVCTWALILRHPVRTLRPFLLILVLECLVLFGLGWTSWERNVSIEAASGLSTVILLFLVGQLGMAWQSISRGARYSAAVQVSRVLVQPLSRPDPWGRRVGGPGGPQYPIDDSDEYGVSI